MGVMKGVKLSAHGSMQRAVNHYMQAWGNCRGDPQFQSFGVYQHKACCPVLTRMHPRSTSMYSDKAMIALCACIDLFCNKPLCNLS